MRMICEIGSWHARSSRAIADNMPNDCILFCIDTWQGSEAEKETNHASAKLLDSDHAFDEFCRNMWDLIVSGKVIPLRMHSKHAAKLLKDKGIQFSFIFIDAGHTKVEVQEDVYNFLPLLKEEGIICGHDYLQGLMPEVTPAIQEIFGVEHLAVGQAGDKPDTTIWYTNYNPLKHQIEVKEKPNIYDCFTFFNELDLLEIRFNELYDVVDRFVVVEATATHQRAAKPLYFKDNLNRFQKFLHKVSHIVVDFPQDLKPFAGTSDPAGEAYWALERYQRDRIMDALGECKDEDIIISSDADEIPNVEAVKKYNTTMGLCELQQKLYYYNFNCRSDGFWQESKILPYRILKTLKPSGARYSRGNPIPNGGWHFSFLGNTEQIIQKVKSWAHNEYNRPDIIDSKHIEETIKEGKDIFKRNDQSFKIVELSQDLPKYILDNIDKYKEKGLIIEK